MVDGLGPVRAGLGLPRGAGRAPRGRGDDAGPEAVVRSDDARSASQPPIPPGTRRIGPTGVDRQHVVGHTVEKGTIVTRDDQGPGPIVEEVFERAQGVEVEVVGRLVENQQIRLPSQHHHELESPLLPSREHSHGRVLSRRIEPEPLEQRLVLVIGLAERTGDHLADRDVGIQRRRVLIGVPDDDRRADVDRCREPLPADRR